MKIEINEYSDIFWVCIEPENLEDAGKLLRISNTAKREPINFTTLFSNNISCEFCINKKDANNFILNKKRD